MLKKIKALFLSWQINKLNQQISNYTGAIFNFKNFLISVMTGAMLFGIGPIVKTLFSTLFIDSPENSDPTSLAENVSNSISPLIHLMVTMGTIFGVLMIVHAFYKFKTSTALSKEALEKTLKEKKASLQALDAKKEMTALKEQINLTKIETKKKALL